MDSIASSLVAGGCMSVAWIVAEELVPIVTEGRRLGARRGCFYAYSWYIPPIESLTQPFKPTVHSRNT